MPVREHAWPEGSPCWVDVVVDDPVEARQFYADLFGWEVHDSPPEAGGYLMAFKNGRPAAGLGPKMPGQEAMPNVWTTYFAAERVDDVAREITEAGGHIHLPPFDVMDVGRMCVASDPAGAVFGVWEAGTHTGAGVYNESGALCWNELHTRGYATAIDFYAEVFGYRIDEVGRDDTFRYSTLTAPGQADACAGIYRDTAMAPESPAYWLTWFQVDDCDVSVSRAMQLGGVVTMGPADSPFGRLSVVRGAQGELFGLIDPTQVIEEPFAESQEYDQRVDA